MNRMYCGEVGRVGHIRAGGTLFLFFLQFVGVRVVVRPQCKSAEYYFHHRPSFAVESSLIYVTTFYKIQKMHFVTVIDTIFKSSIFVIPPRNWCASFQNSPLRSSLINVAAGNLTIKSVLLKKANILKQMGWGRFAHALMGHIRACLFNVL